MSDSTQCFDVIIAGGGLTGSLMALSLAQLTKADGSKLAIAVIETQPLQQLPELSFDDRVLALAHGSAVYLKHCGVWRHIEQDASAIRSIHISDRGHYGKARLHAEEYQVAALGYVIEMSLLGQALLNELQQYSNVQWYCPDNIAETHYSDAQVLVQLSSGQKLQAALLLACDGGHSACRQQAGIDTFYRDYQQTAIIANVATARAHHGKAFERFTEYGPLAMLPLSKGRCSLVWTLSPEIAAQVMTYSDPDFIKALQHAFGGWLGEVTQTGKRFCYPLALTHAKQQSHQRMALLGNASHTIHPIAGQGFNLGIRDVAAMTKIIAQAITLDHDIGAYQQLHSYEQQRVADQRQVIQFTDSLATLFANQYLPLVIGRNIGLKVMNYFTPLQRKLVKKTMGY